MSANDVTPRVIQDGTTFLVTGPAHLADEVIAEYEAEGLVVTRRDADALGPDGPGPGAAPRSPRYRAGPPPDRMQRAPHDGPARGRSARPRTRPTAGSPAAAAAAR